MRATHRRARSSSDGAGGASAGAMARTRPAAAGFGSGKLSVPGGVGTGWGATGGLVDSATGRAGAANSVVTAGGGRSRSIHPHPGQKGDQQSGGRCQDQRRHPEPPRGARPDRGHRFAGAGRPVSGRLPRTPACRVRLPSGGGRLGRRRWRGLPRCRRGRRRLEGHGGREAQERLARRGWCRWTEDGRRRQGGGQLQRCGRRRSNRPRLGLGLGRPHDHRSKVLAGVFPLEEIGRAVLRLDVGHRGESKATPGWGDRSDGSGAVRRLWSGGRGAGFTLGGRP